MQCWVAPAVAAEMWGVSIDEVLSRVARTEIDSKCEGGFMFVDMAPKAAPQMPVETPSTYMVLSDEEVAALSESTEAAAEAAPETFFDEETPTFSASDWRRVRAQTARTRRPPPGSATRAA